MFIDDLNAIDQTELRLNNAEAADILHNVVSAYDALFNRFEKAQADKKPLYVLMGEYHNRPAHHIAHTLLIRALSDLTQPIVTALECPINITAADHPDIKPEYLTKNTVSKESAANIDLLANYNTSEYAPYSGKSFELSLCHQQDCLVTIFNDIARNEDHSLNLTNILGTNEDDPSWGMSPKSLNGVALRNIHMSEKLVEAVKKYKAPLGIQICGQAHVNGSKHDSPKESLCGLLKAQGKNVFNIFWGAESAMLTNLAPSELYLSQNMPDRFIEYDLNEAIEETNPKAVENYTLEKDYVHGIYDALGIKAPI
ncbi:MAG: hypothetical protein CL561_03925 [Alphaproteobacteria bacterium]|nr:hypothetical protein [Alphaproteobacteria bacterium]|tara:strand:- start:3586 stop:4521 length:936 start_codon:yes stop_codon:yes gene_type:complete